MKKLLLGIAIPLLLCTQTVSAGAFYLGGHGGLQFVDESRNTGPEGRFNLKFDPGFHGAAVMGFDLADRYPSIGIGRIEVEAALRQSDVDRISFQEGPMPVEGKVRAESLMFNTFGEHRESLPWIPYIGAGAGVARVRMENVSSPLGGVVVDDDDTVFAWQVGAGLGMQAFRHLAFDIGYRYFQAHQPKFMDSMGQEFRARYRSHSVILGARLMF